MVKVEDKTLLEKFLDIVGRDWVVKDIDDGNVVVVYVGRRIGTRGWEIVRVFEDVKLRWLVATHRNNKGLSYRKAWKNRTSLNYSGYMEVV